MVGGAAGLHAASTGGDDVLSAVGSETAPDAAGRIEDGDGDSPPGSGSLNLGAYWDILRPQNIPSSFGLVAAGALVASHSVGSMLDPKVGCTWVGW